MILNIGKSFVVMKWGYYEFFRYSYDAYYGNHLWTGVTHTFGEIYYQHNFIDSKKRVMKKVYDFALKKKYEL